MKPFLKHKNLKILNTHDVGIQLPKNTKYLSGNLLSRWLIRHFVGTLSFMISSIDIPVKTILDVGCGEGIIPRQIKDLWPSATFHGLDIDHDLLKVAMKLVPELKCVASSVYSLPFREESFDLVCCTEVLEHLEHPRPALSEISRVGKEYLIFSVPDEPFWRIANMLRGAYLSEWGNSPGHVNHWQASVFIRFLSHYFDIVEVKRSFPWTIVLCRKK